MDLHNRITNRKQQTVRIAPRIFLMLRSDDDTWQSTICSSLNHAVEVWGSKQRSEKNAGVLHIGFEKPLPRVFDNIATRYSRQILITASAKYILPKSFVSSNKPVAFVGNLALYLGLQGWGYCLKNKTTKNANTLNKLQDWVADYMREHPHSTRMLNIYKIYDDDSYLDAEHNLDWRTRQQLGIFRMHYLLEDKYTDPCEFARAAPPWLAKQKLSDMNLTTRALRILKKNNIRIVADLATWTTEKLLKEPSLGYRTMYSISTCLNSTLVGDRIHHTQPSSASSPNNKPAANTETKLNLSRRLIEAMRYGMYCDDPCEFARAVLPWFGKRKLSELNFMPRIYSTLEKQNITTIADLAACNTEELRKNQHLGPKSLQHIMHCLNTELTDSVAQDIKHTLNTSLMTDMQIDYSINFSFLDHIKHFMSLLNDCERYVFAHRLGYRVKPRSLQKIAANYGACLEDICKIEFKLTEKLRYSSFWCVFAQKITRLLSENTPMLAIDEIEITDSWFKGLSNQQKFFVNLVHLTDNDHVHLIEMDKVFYLSNIKQSVWNGIVEQAAVLLYSATNNNWSEAKTRLSVKRLLPFDSEKLKRLLWEHVSKLYGFKVSPNRKTPITIQSKKLRGMIREILAASDIPLHYTEIAELVSLKQGVNLDITKVHRAVCDVGFLFNRGTYGLIEHLPFSDEQTTYIRTMAEATALSHNTKTQWHSTEILTKLPEQVLRVFEKLDQYLLNIILAESKILSAIGHNTWNIAGPKNNAPKRINIFRSVISVIEEAGHPLSSSEIRKRLAAVCGVNKNLCIPLRDPLIRIQPGIWGINDRDVPIPREQQQKLIDELVDKLNEKQRSIYLYEIADILPLGNCSPYTFFTIAVQDKRLRKTRINYCIRLTEWKDDRID